MTTKSEVASLAHRCKISVVVELRTKLAHFIGIVDTQKVSDRQPISHSAQNAAPVAPIKDPGLLGRFDCPSDSANGAGSLTGFSFRSVVVVLPTVPAINAILTVALKKDSVCTVTEAAGPTRVRFPATPQELPSPGDMEASRFPVQVRIGGFASPELKLIFHGNLASYGMQPSRRGGAPTTNPWPRKGCPLRLMRSPSWLLRREPSGRCGRHGHIGGWCTRGNRILGREPAVPGGWQGDGGGPARDVE